MKVKIIHKEELVFEAGDLTYFIDENQNKIPVVIIKESNSSSGIVRVYNLFTGQVGDINSSSLKITQKNLFRDMNTLKRVEGYKDLPFINYDI